jgi:hypothetical protein
MTRILVVMTALVVALFSSVSLASAQVPVKQARIFLDSVTQTNACNASQETWQIMSGTCAAPGTTPWIQNLRIRVGTTQIDIPRANVSRLTTAGECTPNAPPCLRANPVTLPAGNVTVAFVTGDGEEGAPSAAVPFSPTAALPSAPAGPRLVVVP